MKAVDLLDRKGVDNVNSSDGHAISRIRIRKSSQCDAVCQRRMQTMARIEIQQFRVVWSRDSARPTCSRSFVRRVNSFHTRRILLNEKFHGHESGVVLAERRRSYRWKAVMRGLGLLLVFYGLYLSFGWDLADTLANFRRNRPRATIAVSTTGDFGYSLSSMSRSVAKANGHARPFHRWF